LYCAGIIYEKANPFEGEYQTGSVWLMLHAYAFENLLKGLIITKEKKQGLNINVGKLSHHNLLLLVTEAGFKCTEDELNLLKSLQYFGVIQGRYRLPKNWKEYKKQQGGEFSSDYPNKIVSLIHKIEYEFRILGIELDIYDWSLYSTAADGKINRVERKINVPYYPRHKTKRNSP